MRNIEQCLIEVIKYSTKIFTDPDAMRKGIMPQKVYAAALDNIFQAMESHRIFDRFGFDTPKVNKECKVQIIPESQCEDFIYAVEVCDWINTKNGARLIDYAPSAQLDWLLHENIDTELQ